MLLSNASQLFLRAKKLQGLHPSSLRDYEVFISLFQQAVGDIEISSITPELIEEYSLSLYEPERNLSRASIGTYLRNLKVFLRFLESDRKTKCEIDPELFNDTKHPLSSVIRIPKVYRRKVDILTPEEVQSIFEAAYEKGNLVKTRNALIIALMLDCGLRREEVTRLTNARINYRSRKITVLGKGSKERLVPMGNFTLSILQEYRNLLARSDKLSEQPHDPLLLTITNQPITNNTIKLMFCSLRKETELSFSAHTLRHNFATNWCIDEYDRCGTIDVFRLQILMGHEDIQTTLIYVHMAQEILAAQNSVSHLDTIGISLSSCI